MCHVLSEGSKWSGWVRPCGLSPCAPRYYYSTPRCPIVYGLVLSSVCCAPVWCCVPCLRCSCAPVLWCALCLACAACGVSAWCCGCGASCPCSPCPLWVCATVCPVLPVRMPSIFRPYTGVYIGGRKKYPYTRAATLPYVGVEFTALFYLC